LPNLVEDGRNPSMHRGASYTTGLGKKPMVHGGPGHLKTKCRIGLSTLMPFIQDAKSRLSG
jgi:hypothetical protein